MIDLNIKKYKKINFLVFFYVSFLLFYGIHYHTSKTIFHLLALSGVILFFYEIIKNKLQVKYSYKSFWFLVVSSAIVFCESFFEENKEAARFFNNTFIPLAGVFFTLPLLLRIKNLQQLMLFCLPVSTLFLAFSGVYDYWQHASNGSYNYRTHGGVNQHIVYASVLCLMASLTIVIGIYTNKKKLVALCLIAFVFAIMAIVFTGSRGPIASVVLLSVLIFSVELSKKYSVKTVLCFIVIIAVFLVAGLWKSPVGNRFITGVENAFKYKKNNVRATSVGWRFEMWKGGFIAIKNYPFAGIGVGNHKEYFNELNKAEPGFIHPVATGFGHLHNDPITIFAWMGVPLGFLFYLFLLVPLVTFIKHFSEDYIARMGLYAVLSYILCGMTSVLFMNAVSFTLYLLFITHLYWLCQQKAINDTTSVRKKN